MMSEWLTDAELDEILAHVGYIVMRQGQVGVSYGTTVHREQELRSLFVRAVSELGQRRRGRPTDSYGDRIFAALRTVAARLDAEGDLGRREAQHLREAYAWILQLRDQAEKQTRRERVLADLEEHPDAPHNNQLMSEAREMRDTLMRENGAVEPVAFAADELRISIRRPTLSPYEVVREVPVGWLAAYQRARQQLTDAREDVLRAAGFDPETAWDELMDVQANVLEREAEDE